MQAGSWLWRAIPSTLLGLAGSRGSPRDPHPPPARDLHGEGGETQRRGSLDSAHPLPDLQTVPKAPSSDRGLTGGLHQEEAAATIQQRDTVGPHPRRRRPSSRGGEDRDPPDIATPATAVPTGRPRPKRRRLVEALPAAPRAAACISPEVMRRRVAAFVREHLPLLGDLVCSQLEAPGLKTGVSTSPPSGGPPTPEGSSEGAPEKDECKRAAEIQVLQCISSFLMEAAGDSLGLMLAGDSSNNTANSCNGSETTLPYQVPPLHDASLPPLASSKESYRPPSVPAVAAAPLQPKQQQLSQRQPPQAHEEDEGLSLLRLLQQPSPPRTSWSHGVFFKYAFVDLDFECLATFRICLCHHPLFIFYKEHEKGLHVLHVDGE